MNIDNIYQDMLKVDYNEKVVKAKALIKEIVKYFNTIYESRGDNNYLLMQLLGGFLGSDDKLSEKEFIFIKEILERDLDFIKIQNLLQTTTKEEVNELVDMLVNVAPEEVKNYIMNLGIILSTIDGEITESEKDFVRKFN